MTRFKAYTNYHCAFKYPFVPNVDADAALYQAGFLSAQEKREGEQFHKALFNKDHAIINQIKSPRIKQLALRILKRNFLDQYQNIEDPDFANHLKCLGSALESDQIFAFQEKVHFHQRIVDSEIIFQGINPDEKEPGLLGIEQSYYYKG